MAGIERIQPGELFQSAPYGFTQVTTSPPGKLVFVSGQVAWNAANELIGGDDLGAQAEQALANMGHALRAAGATPADVTMTRAYIVGFQPSHAAVVGPAFAKFFADCEPPASTWVGVTALAGPDFLVEIEAIAVVSD